MDFDITDSENEASFEEMLADARAEILKTATPETPIEWGALVEKYEAFKDVSREACKRGEVLGPVLVVAQLLAEQVALQTMAANEATSSGSPSPASSGCSPAESVLLLALANLYVDLYIASPVPTRAAWQQLVRATFRDEATRASVVSIMDSVKSSRPLYVGALAEAVSVTGNSERGADVDVASVVGDDGSFAEDAFKEFLRRLVAVWRKCTRTARNSIDADNVRLLSDYLRGGTVEW